jgi:inner membrane protein
MLFLTHLVVASIFFLLLRSVTSEGYILIIAFLVFLGSIFPDIDEPHSKINQWSGFIGKIITFFTKHRGIFHSFWPYIIFSAILSYFSRWPYGLAFFIGYLSHFFSDSLTRMGIAPLYPFSEQRIYGPVRVGSWMEYVLLGIFLLFLGTIIWFKFSFLF